MTATTPKHAIPYPESTDPPNGAAQMQALATAVDNLIIEPVPVYRVYNANATWNKPASGRFLGVWAEVQGGGGAGGGAQLTAAGQSAFAGGGQGGAYAKAWIPAADLAAAVAVTIGAGGVAAAGAVGGTGGSTSFGAHLVAPGGAGGAVGPAGATLGDDSGTGGSSNQVITGSATPKMTIIGFDGVNGIRVTATAGFAGSGGGSLMAGSTRASATSSNDGFAGKVNGGGGSGARNAASQAARPGGNGGAGCLIVTEVYG